MEMILLLIIVALVILCAIIIFKRTATDGELIIDTSNPDRDIYRLELGNEFEKLGRKKTIKLKIVHRVISQR